MVITMATTWIYYVWFGYTKGWVQCAFVTWRIHIYNIIHVLQVPLNWLFLFWRFQALAIQPLSSPWECLTIRTHTHDACISPRHTLMSSPWMCCFSQLLAVFDCLAHPRWSKTKQVIWWFKLNIVTCRHIATLTSDITTGYINSRIRRLIK